jgi:hypothetical protein
MNNHLTHQQMLAYLDGELSKSETSRAAEHLHACWTCRIEMERLESDIAVILDAQNESFAPAIPPPSGAWPSFEVLLARRLPTAPQPLWMRFGNAFRTVFTPLRGAVLAGLVAGVALFVYLKVETKPVSAKEVLHSVQAADRQRTSIADGQVIRQRVHVSRKAHGQSQTQVGLIDAWKSPKASVWQNPDDTSAVVALKEEYKAHGVPMDLPLSESSFEAWGKVAGGDPSVTKQGGNLDLSFASVSDASTQTGASVSLRIRPGTWHVEQMTLEFSDASFEVTEDHFSVVPTSAVPPILLAELEPGPQLSVPATTHPVSDAMMTAIHLPQMNLDQVQLDVLMTLHRLHADLGEPVTVTHSSRRVEVGVWQLPPDRQREIREALLGEAGVAIQTAPPVQRPLVAASAPPVLSQSSALARITVPSVDEDQRLVKFFGSPEKEQTFTRDALEKSTAVLAHLYALRNLQAQFPPEREATLSPAAQTQLASIIQDHATSVSSALSDLQSQLAPLNGAFHVAATSSASASEAYESRWQDASLDALGTARSADHLLRDVLTTSDTVTAPDVALPELQQKLERLAAEMRGLQKM